DDWQETYRTLVRWELELADAAPDMHEMLELQKNEANVAIAKFVKKNYGTWVKNMADEAPLMSPRLFKNKIFPLLDAGEKVFFVLIDNFRFDQWRVIRPILSDYFTCDDEMYYSILPTATQYARNAIFSGLMPLDIQKLFPQLWVDEDSDEGKNLNESPLIATQFDRYRRKCRFSYNKINDNAAGERLLRDFASLEDNDLNVVVFNFIDMLSHARTESKMIRELAATNAAYRSLTESWFRHSSAFEFLRKVAESGYKVVLTTDHGTIKVTGPVKVVGEKNTNTNLRYKLGRNLSYNPRQVFEIQRPRDFGLPAPNVSTRYIFATGRDFFAYPNNYSYYVQYYTDTFQHGGVSMEEMLVPVITMIPKQ
ncbi:MAG: PglZ domain-containing protein, partial [Paramuribaculum sp.]|nr:PglZ domain-containing protein [Paramuribaculum sp.]